MGKKRFTSEDKIKIVELYIRNGMGYGQISGKYGVPATTLRHWVMKYQTFGAKGLMQKKSNQPYSSELK